MSLLQQLDDYRIPLNDIKDATNNFGHENVIEKGIYGKVYKGQLFLHSKRLVKVAAKLVDEGYSHGETHFLNDMKVVSSYMHTNIVSFIGFCNEHDKKIVVEEFVTYGSLEKYLSSTRLTWLRRLQICLGAARGLNHLHNGHQLLHCDIRSRTILLDEKWQAKITGFGLPVMGSMPPTIFGIIGGLGYVDPRYIETGIVSKESDVYSFGVVLFEVLFGKLAYEINKDNKFGPFARLCYEEGTLKDIINPILREQMTADSLEAFSAIAYQCLEKHQSRRPKMIEIVQRLDHVWGLQQQFEQQFDKESTFKHVKGVEALRTSLDIIKFATKYFSDIAEYRGCDKVYRGKLPHSKGHVDVIVKWPDPRVGSYGNKFYKDVVMLHGCSHNNVIPLLGFCEEERKMIVVFEHMVNGNLKDHVKNTSLTWKQRLQICVDAARGLEYIHGGADTRYSIHGGIKSSSILLNHDWKAVISDFIIPKGVGTLGYFDPHYATTGIPTHESDVYSLGVVLFEVLSGRYAIDTLKTEQQHPLHDFPNVEPVSHGRGANVDGQMIFLAPLATQCFKNKKLEEIVFHHLKEQIDAKSLVIFSTIAYQCLQEQLEDRPTMGKVVKELEKAFECQVAFELKEKQGDGHDSYKVKNLEYMKIPLQEIKLATNDFHDDYLIGRGGYGKVYKADLFHFDVQKYIPNNIFQQVSMDELSGYQRRKSTVAVKRLDRKFGQGTAEFLQEISVLLNFTHPNLVTLLGFCDEDHERILVYEYASKGSLDGYICSTDTKNNDTWALRLQICLDAARALDFLHNVKENLKIIHRDVKSSNILLDQNWVGKISDFGLSRISHANLPATFVMTQVAGTAGYIDPQYWKTGRLTKGSDVYSFGVVLFEVLSGRLAKHPESKDGEEPLPRIAKSCFEQNKVSEIIDPKLKKEFDDEKCPNTISIFAAIAYKCLQEKQEDRPSMTEVVEELEKAWKSHVKGVEALRTSLDIIRYATKDFSDIVEYSIYGHVYRGKLPHSKSHIDVIVKRLDPIVGSYGNKFYEDIVVLHRCSHKNVIPLLGFCEEERERIVVFEHMVNGSLKDHVKNTSLTWKQRIQICVDAAHGLEYIHGGSDTGHSIHGGIKSSSILLNHDWKAVISDFIIPKGVGTLGYFDPHYATTGIPTHESDVYSLGVVLFEVLSGRYATETFRMDQQHLLHDVPNVEPVNHGRGENVDGRQIIFLAQLAVQCFKNKRLEEIILHDLKGHIDAKSLDIFSTIAYQCLQEQLEDRPTVGKVVKELEKAFECQDEWEWEQKLPRDYEKIIQMSKYPVSNTSTKKDLHSLLSSGILLHGEKLWYSISVDGVTNSMVSATKFSYKNVKWKSKQKSRFSKVAKISDVSNLNIQIQIKTQFLTQDIMYRVYLVFKFCDRRKVSSRPLYVNLKYKKAGETLNAYFAEWRAGNQWLAIELFRFWNNNKTTDFDVMLESLSSYYCGNLGIFIEGIEFQPIHSADCIENKELNDENNTINASKDGKKVFSLSKVNGKKCHMLPAKAVIYDPSNVKFYDIKPQAQSRFAEYVEILSHHELRIKCNIEKQMLSSDTMYACFLVFKLSEKCRGLKCPVKARDLLPYKNFERTKIISFISPSTVNMDKIKWIPKLREDGWMEVIVWETETISDMHDGESILMDLKLISFEGTMFGLIVCGIEFRPM